jgi:hypothetical protein
LRRKKRYVLLEKMPEKLPAEAKFLFQTDKGFVMRVSLKEAEELRTNSVKITGSIRKLKNSKTPK